MSETTTKGVTPFTQTLQFLERGMLNEELSEELAGIVKAVRETGRKGTLTLNIDVAMMKGHEDAVQVSAKINAKAPKADRAQTVMFSTYDGDLLRDDPVQHNLELRTVAKQDGQPLKTVNGGN
jgi:hypothetical protein